MKAPGHIIAMGGGGFSMERGRSPLDDYVLAQSGKRTPKVCFIPTASGDSATYIAKFERAFGSGRASPSVLRLFTREHKDLAPFIAQQDVLYVGGGNTANLLAVWRTHGLDRLITKFWRAGGVLAGISAGMNCWFEACSTDSFGPLAPLNDGLGLLAGAACPHFDGEAQRRPCLHRWVGAGTLPTTYAADDYAALHFVGRRLHACVSSRKGRRCFKVEKSGRSVVETPLETRPLR